MSVWERVGTSWTQPVSGAGLAWWRWVFAGVLGWRIASAWWVGDFVERVTEANLHFKYPLFSWVIPPQGMVPDVYAVVLVGLCVSVLLGWRTRWTAALLAIGWAYWFLIDAANYSDEGYLLIVMAGLGAWLPLSRWGGVDRYVGREKSDLVPGWSLQLVRMQIALIYFFQGLAVMNGEWWQGVPLVEWQALHDLDSPMPGHQDTNFVIGIARFWAVWQWLQIPLLWNRWTVYPALVVSSGLLLADSWWWGLSCSPLVLGLANFVFLPPRVWEFFGRGVVGIVSRLPFAGLVWSVVCRLGSLLDRLVSWFDDTPVVGTPAQRGVGSELPVPQVTVEFSGRAQVAVLVWLLIQAAIPLRAYLSPGPVGYTDLASTFAWRGHTTDKRTELAMYVEQPSQELRWPVDPTDDYPLSMEIAFRQETLDRLGINDGMLKDLVGGAEETQAERIASMKLEQNTVDRAFQGYEAIGRLLLRDYQWKQVQARPELLRQYAHFIQQSLGGFLKEELIVNVEWQVVYNYRPKQAVLKEDYDLLEAANTQILAKELQPLASPFPESAERMVAAREAAEIRRQEQALEFEATGKRRRGEPIKLPPLSEADERWFQALLQKKP